MKLTSFESFAPITRLNVVETRIASLGVDGEDGTVLLRPLSAEEAIKFTQNLDSPEGRKNANINMVKLSVVDESGNLVFDTPEKVNVLKQMPFKVIREIATAALRLNGLGADNEGAAVEATKNV